MNSDDPKSTAFALGELTPAERQEIERELRDNPELAAEVSETREMAGILKKQLAAEPAGSLAEHQRWAIIRAATATRPPGVNERNVVIEASWWQRAGVWQAVAACAVFGFGVYAISVQLTKPRGQTGRDSTDGIVITIPKEDSADVASGAPEIITPAEAQRRLAALGGAVSDAAKAFPRGAVIVPPRIAEHLKPDAPKAMQPLEGPKIEMAQEDGKFVVRIPTNGRNAKPSNGPQRPEPVAEGPAAANYASVARPANVNDAVVSDTVKKLVKEAAAFREGSTFAEFRQKFIPVPGMAGRYQMIQLPTMKVDVEFIGADSQPATNPPADDAKIKTISKLYPTTD